MTPQELYRLERDKAQHRIAAAKKVEMAAVTKAWKAHLKQQLDAGRGGRPKGTKPKSYTIPSRGGKPRLELTRDRIPDLSSQLGHFEGLGR